MNIFGTLFNILMAPFNALKGAIGYIFGPQSALGGVYTFLADMFSGLFDLITLPFRKVWEFVSMIFTDPLAALQSLWNGLTGGVANLLGLITMPIDAAINWVMGLFGFGDPDKPFSLLGLIGDTVSSIWDWFKGLFTFDASGLMDGLFSIGRIMKGLAKGGWAAIKAMLPGGESPGEAFSRVYNEVSSGGQGSMPDEKMDTVEGAEVSPAPTMSVENADKIKSEMNKIRDRIERSNAGENVYTGPDAIGRGVDILKLQAMEKQFSNLVSSTNVENTKQVDSGTNVENIKQLEKIKAEREELKEQYENTPSYKRLEKRRIRDEDRKLANEQLKLEKEAEAKVSYPKDIQLGYVPGSPERLFFTFGPNGEYQVLEDQDKAGSSYGLQSITSSPESSSTIQKTTALTQASMTSSDLTREYMQAPSAPTVIAPNSVTNISNSSNGGTTVMPISMSDNSSASKAAGVAY